MADIREAAAPVFVRAAVAVFGVTMIVLGLWAWLAALVVRDALVVVLSGFLVANTLHAINHGIDLAFGGHVADMPALAGFSVLAAVALALRVRQLRKGTR